MSVFGTSEFSMNNWPGVSAPGGGRARLGLSEESEAEQMALLQGQSWKVGSVTPRKPCIFLLYLPGRGAS